MNNGNESKKRKEVKTMKKQTNKNEMKITLLMFGLEKQKKQKKKTFFSFFWVLFPFSVQTEIYWVKILFYFLRKKMKKKWTHFNLFVAAAVLLLAFSMQENKLKITINCFITKYI